MSEFNNCPDCKEMVWTKESHKCTPIYFKHEYWGDEWQKRYHQGSVESFAESIASDSFSDDPCDPHHFEFPVLIKREDKEYSFVVTAEARVDFTAREAKP